MEIRCSKRVDFIHTVWKRTFTIHWLINQIIGRKRGGYPRWNHTAILTQAYNYIYVLFVSKFFVLKKNVRSPVDRNTFKINGALRTTTNQICSNLFIVNNNNKYLLNETLYNTKPSVISKLTFFYHETLSPTHKKLIHLIQIRKLYNSNIEIQLTKKKFLRNLNINLNDNL